MRAGNALGHELRSCIPYSCQLKVEVDQAPPLFSPLFFGVNEFCCRGRSSFSFTPLFVFPCHSLLNQDRIPSLSQIWLRTSWDSAKDCRSSVHPPLSFQVEEILPFVSRFRFLPLFRGSLDIRVFRAPGYTSVVSPSLLAHT